MKAPSQEAAFVEKLLAKADIKIQGDRPWDIQVHRPELYKRVLYGGSLALGESYMDGWWDCDALDQFFDRVLRNRLDKEVRPTSPLLFLRFLRARLMNVQRGARAYEIGRRHYDIGNELFRLMLDKWMNYSCGFWASARTLDEAQEAKMELICQKLELEPGMKLLDIGCGWGGLARYAAERYGVSVHGITVSQKQVAFARDFCRDVDVTIELKDYRDLRGTYDRIVSVGMFEHVGYKNYRTYMEVVHRCLKPDGRFLLHTIGRNASGVTSDPWIEKYIFPNSMLPSVKQIAEAAEGLFVLEDWHNFGHHYDPTLMAWYRNFTTHWDQLKDKYDERFYRMWTYYLLSCAGGFRARQNQLWQVVFSKQGVPGGYRYRDNLERLRVKGHLSHA